MFTGRCIAILCLLTSLLRAQPAKTTIQDTIYKADGTPFNGTAVIFWRTFQAGDTSAIGQQVLSSPIVNGGLYVQLVPTTTATPVSYYIVHYSSDGHEQFIETWAVPPSATPLRVAAVRVTPGSTTAGGGTGGTGGQTPVLETDVVGLVADLAIRPVEGPGYAASRTAVINDAGEIEAAVGSPGDCMLVDGTSAPCATAGSGGGGTITFVDSETPAGNVDGINATFTLANTPSPAAGLSLFRSGVYQTAGVDFSLNGNVIQFLAGSTPQFADILTASYRLAGAGALTALATSNSALLLSGNLTLPIVDTAFPRRGHKAMVIGDSQVGASSADEPFPTIPANWFGQAVVESQSRIRYWGNAGIAGDTTANMLARLTADVIEQSPDKVFIEAGLSDIAASVPVATIAANINTMINRLKAAKIQPVVCTLPPSAANALSVVQLNFQLRQIADAQGISLVDFYSILVDPHSGQYRTGYSIDSVNPVMPATRLMAKAAITALGTTSDPTSPWLPVTDSDGINLVLDPVFLQSPSRWIQTASTVPAAFNIAADPNLPGNLLILQKSDSAGVDVITGSAVSAGFSPGDRLAFTGTIASSGCESGSLQFDISLVFNPGAATLRPIYHWAVDVQAGQWYVEFNVPANATSMTPVFQLNSGVGTVVIGHVGVVNLTAMGF